jgi:ribosomal protein L37AE/L43A
MSETKPATRFHLLYLSSSTSPRDAGGFEVKMRVVCGDPECRKEFPVSSDDPVWECPSCGRKIENKKYPFLTAKFMQASIDGGDADWKSLFSDLIEQTRTEIVKRTEGRDVAPDLSFLDRAEDLLGTESKGTSSWRENYEWLFSEARKLILKLDEL